MTDPTPTRAFLDANVLYAAAIDPLGWSSKLWQIANVKLVTNEFAAQEAWVNLGNAPNAAAHHARLATLLAAVEVHPIDRGHHRTAELPVGTQ